MLLCLTSLLRYTHPPTGRADRSRDSICIVIRYAIPDLSVWISADVLTYKADTMPSTTGLALLHRTSLFDPTSSQPSASSLPTTWSLPTSYRVALLLNAFIILVFAGVVIWLTLYLRRRRTHTGNLDLPSIRYSQEEEEEESLLRSPKHKGLEITIRELSVDEKMRMRGPLSPALSLAGSERRKKGHVRWTSSVQGGEVFGLGDPSEDEDEHITSEVEVVMVAERGVKKEVSVKEDMKCRCRGRRHPECWRFEISFEGDVPTLGEEREEVVRRK